VADRLSNAKMEQLGKRLIAAAEPAPGDRALLQEILLSRSAQLEIAIARVRGELDLSPTSRVKNTGTILEKLRRQGGWTLASMQDLAGMRIVGELTRGGQDEVVSRLCEVFADGSRQPRVIDRRERPMHGYRAVHVIVCPDGAPIEIQVRTEWQHEWAELFEKLADLVGRGIRYGEPPRVLVEDASADPEQLSAALDMVIDVVLKVSDAVALVETIDSIDRPRFAAVRRAMDSLLTLARSAIDELEDRIRSL
jgi:ppGpp synthetase/RelA/SpoT-type nucleotidyltranferase